MDDEKDEFGPLVWPEELLAGQAPEALVELLVASEDRAPRNLIDACVQCGPAMVDALHRRLDIPWDDIESDGEWWLRLHAVMILGLIPDESAGLYLIDLMQRLDAEKEDEIQDWLATCWSACFANKSALLVGKLRDLALDRSMHWYMRANAMDAVVAAGECAGTAALNEELAWVAAAIAGNADEDLDMRLTAADLLLDHPRPEHRALLVDLANLQQEQDCILHFRLEDIDAAYTSGLDTPEWRRFDNPWQFYNEDAIRTRQLRWAEEDAADDIEDEGLFDEVVSQPYYRDAPKIGRNDSCPCGSGKKYKKCCLNPDQTPPLIFN